MSLCAGVCRTKLGAERVISLLHEAGCARCAFTSSALCFQTPSLCLSMKSTRSSSSFQGAASGSVDLSLTGLPAPVLRRPSSASPAKQVARSVSVTTDGKPKRNALEDAGSRAMNNLRRSNSTTQVNQRVNSTRSSEQMGDFLTFFESGSGGRKKPASLSKTSPEKKTTWNILDDQPRVFPGPSSSRGIEPPAGMRKKEATVLLAANFTANNRSNKGAMGNSVTTMVHNNYSTTEKGPAPKSSNQAPSSLNNVVKATSNEDGESSSFVKSQKNFSSNNIMTRNNNSSQPRRKEVTEEEAERFIQRVNLAAVTIQRWYRRHSQRHRAGAAALERLLASKREERQQRMEEGNILDLQERKDEERRKIREEKARLARRAAIQELHQKRAQKALDAKRLAEEELVLVKESRRVAKKKPAKPASARNISPASSITKANNAEVNFHPVAAEPEESSLADLGSMPSRDPGAEDKLQDVSSREMGGEDLETVVTAVSRAQSKVTLNELLDTLRLLEEEPELLPPPKLFKKDRYAWVDGEPSSNSLTADNLEKFGKLNHSPGVPEDGALLSEAKLQSIISFLDEMEKSEQERPRSAASATQREGLLSEEELAHLEQASAVATEVTSSIMRLKLEVEEKKRAISLLQTALAQQRELTVRHVKQTEKELGHQLRLQREQYEAAIQRHLAFIDQLIDDKKVLSEKCEAVVAELKQVDQKYGKKITQMQEQHELVWRTLGPFCEQEIKKLKELMSATEKIKREKWIDEKTKKIKEITVKGLEPEIQKLIAKHRQDIRKLKKLHEAELLQSDERAAQHYGRQAEELRDLLEREKEEQSQRERELARQRCEQQLEQEEQALQQQRRRLYAEVAEEKERLSQQAARQRAEAEELRQQLEASSSAVTRALKEEYTKEKEEQERRHQAEVKVLKERLEIEKQAWEANYVKKEEAWLLSRERELREEMRKERDKEIELVIQRLEADMSSAKEECERAAENRIKRIRDKYEVEFQELERSERKLQERCNELKGRLAELEGESIRLQGLLKHKEQEVEEIQKVRDQLAQERSSLAEVIRQEFTDRLVGTEEENKRLKAEMVEMRARQRLELDRVVREKDKELEEVHRRVKTAVARKEESVSSLRKQYEAAVQRADRLEALLEQQRKQLLANN
ncbi:centrosomal protein of 131 kDa isoform X3 [Rissa tridactyla]|uniref:centrosomal protein of 131 kDa isoform X3 n=1 Tax=Rissa tridactyla TaxID=75485 RepID=UPI0023BA71BE|nr:centrosomal protein of 131 kDa isoform X3 [Rissa tridactyla]